MIWFTIDLAARSKKNHRPIFKNARTGKVFLGKDAGLVQYEKDCHLILTAQKNRLGMKEPLSGRLHCECVFEFKGKNRADLDNLTTMAWDVCVSAGIIADDFLIKSCKMEVRYDTGKDRTLIGFEVLN